MVNDQGQRSARPKGVGEHPLCHKLWASAAEAKKGYQSKSIKFLTHFSNIREKGYFSKSELSVSKERFPNKDAPNIGIYVA